MQDLQYAAKEKQTQEHDVIDEAIRDSAAVQQFCLNITNETGVHCLLRPSRRHFPTIRSQNQECTEKGLSR